MSKYRVKYFFDGFGEVLIEANNKKEAEEKFDEGEFNEEDDKEWGENYEIDNMKEI